MVKLHTPGVIVPSPLHGRMTQVPAAEPAVFNITFFWDACFSVIFWLFCEHLHKWRWTRLMSGQVTWNFKNTHATLIQTTHGYPWAPYHKWRNHPGGISRAYPTIYGVLIIMDTIATSPRRSRSVEQVDLGVWSFDHTTYMIQERTMKAGWISKDRGIAHSFMPTKTYTGSSLLPRLRTWDFSIMITFISFCGLIAQTT